MFQWNSGAGVSIRYESKRCAFSYSTEGIASEKIRLSGNSRDSTDNMFFLFLFTSDTGFVTCLGNKGDLN